MNPIAPVATNAARQLQVRTIQGTRTGVMMAPTFVPALKMPVVRARSFLGNHSATVLIEAGELPPSPRPRAEGGTPQPRALGAGARGMAAEAHPMKGRGEP